MLSVGVLEGTTLTCGLILDVVSLLPSFSGRNYCSWSYSFLFFTILSIVHLVKLFNSSIQKEKYIFRGEKEILIGN